MIGIVEVAATHSHISPERGVRGSIPPNDPLLRQLDRYWWDMSRVVVTVDVLRAIDPAAKSVPNDWRFNPETLFTPHAFVMYEKPLDFDVWGAERLCGFLWTSGRFHVGGGFWADGVLAPIVESAQVQIQFGPHTRYAIMPPMPIEFGTRPLVAIEEEVSYRPEVGTDTDPIQYALLTYRQFIAFATFANSRIVTESKNPISRSERRRAQRKNVQLGGVKKIILRRYHRVTQGIIEGASVEWSKRWIVTGHWRNQWFPSVQERRPVWIAPYVKGPDGKPLDDPMKIFEVSR